MQIAITYYNDIPLSKEEYIAKIGAAVIESFEINKNAQIVSFVRFNRAEYAKWLNGKTDKPEHRAIWATTQISPSKQLQKANQKLKVCEVCGTEFIGTGKSKFCSNRCKQINKNTK